MKVLIGCEESGVVRDAFRELGHDAWSCDLLPSDDMTYHLQGDVMRAIKHTDWDLIILHPPCTHLSLSGNRWYGRGTEGFSKRVEAVEWTARLWKLAKANAPRVALENPTSVIFPILKRECEVQYIQPHQFGHKEVKKTGFALHNLPPLVPTDELVVPTPGSEEMKEWEKVWRMGPSEERQRLRSRTYEGVGEAMAKQWSVLDG